ncbi:MAG: SAM-dependent methyltransferase [Ruminococcaceae bacterium]|nr:SAM-dependent methyltransferase [Oscillospiraceae bacterium]
MKQLKTRLYTVSTLVPKGARVADIGTDHGHLPIYLVQRGICPNCIACDIKEKPLENARTNIEKVGISSIETRLGSGLEVVLPNEVDCITVAGMGGEVISAILENAPWVKDNKYTLILQPMTSADHLRIWLCENGFSIETEVACEENRKVYTVIKAVFSGECFTPDEVFCRIGKLKPDKEDNIKYIEKQAKIIKSLIDERSKEDLDTSLYQDIYSKLLT